MVRRVNDAAEVPAPPSPMRKTFKPYATATRDTPLFHMIVGPCCLSCLSPVLACLYRLRWMMSYPLRVRLLPKWVPPLTTVPVLNHLVNFTVGELVLCAPLIAFTLQGYSYTFVKSDIVSSGAMATYAIFLAFLTANKSNSFFSFLFGIPFERMIPLHLYSSLASVVCGVFHMWAAFSTSGASRYGKLFQDSANLPRYLLDGHVNITGSVALLCIILLTLLSVWPILRRVCFNLWLCSHILLAVGVLVGLVLHSVSSAVFVALWWGLDLMVRYAIQAVCRYRVHGATLRRIGSRDRERGANEPAIEISFPKPEGFDYNAGQFVQIAIPKVSAFEFHPISLSSAPHEKVVTLHIRELGDWTSKLLALVKDEPIFHTMILMEGPYGALSVDLDDDQRYKMAICVSGGIGVTPCQSIGKSLLYQHRILGRRLKYFKFVWAVRDVQMVEDIPPLGGTEDFSCTSVLFKRHSELIERSNSVFRDPSSSSGPAAPKNSKSGCCTRSSSLVSDNGIRRQLPAVVQCDIYCTKELPDAEKVLPYNFHPGRPDVDAIFREMRQTALDTGEHNIAVFGCGPKALMRDLAEACRQHSQPVVGCGDGVFFDLHTETFEL